jgi:hypothetical protein
MCRWGNQDREALALEIQNLFRFDDPDLSTTVEQIIDYIRNFER